MDDDPLSQWLRGDPQPPAAERADAPQAASVPWEGPEPAAPAPHRLRRILLLAALPWMAIAVALVLA
nr:hypothetical protein [Euzebyales bacterium]MBA3622761.1 hypothetical protein [Euzebyales bacterium]